MNESPCWLLLGMSHRVVRAVLLTCFAGPPWQPAGYKKGRSAKKKSSQSQSSPFEAHPRACNQGMCLSDEAIKWWSDNPNQITKSIEVKYVLELLDFFIEIKFHLIIAGNKQYERQGAMCQIWKRQLDLLHLYVQGPKQTQARCQDTCGWYLMGKTRNQEIVALFYKAKWAVESDFPSFCSIWNQLKFIFHIHPLKVTPNSFVD